MIKMDRETTDIPITACTGAVKDVKEREGLTAEKNVGTVFKPFDIDGLLPVVKIRLDWQPSEVAIQPAHTDHFRH